MYVGASQGTGVANILVPPREKIKVSNLDPPWGDETWSTEEVLGTEKRRLLGCQRRIRTAGVRLCYHLSTPLLPKRGNILKELSVMIHLDLFERSLSLGILCTMRHA